MLGAVLTEKGVMGGVDVAASPLGPDLALLSSLFNHKRVCVSVDHASWGLYSCQLRFFLTDGKFES